MSGGDIYDNTNDGLLNFIFDVLQEIKIRNYWDLINKDGKQVSLLTTLSEIILNITNSLKRIEKECEQKFYKINLLLKGIQVQLANNLIVNMAA